MARWSRFWRRFTRSASPPCRTLTRNGRKNRLMGWFAIPTVYTARRGGADWRGDRKRAVLRTGRRSAEHFTAATVGTAHGAVPVPEGVSPAAALCFRGVVCQAVLAQAWSMDPRRRGLRQHAGILREGAADWIHRLGGVDVFHGIRAVEEGAGLADFDIHVAHKMERIAAYSTPLERLFFADEVLL